MQHFRYVVVSQGDRWKIIRGHRRSSESYPDKSQAMCSAIAFAEKDGGPGRKSEVIVRHEDGRFMTEWIFGHDSRPNETARPLITPARN